MPHQQRQQQPTRALPTSRHTPLSSRHRSRSSLDSSQALSSSFSRLDLNESTPHDEHASRGDLSAYTQSQPRREDAARSTTSTAAFVTNPYPSPPSSRPVPSPAPVTASPAKMSTASRARNVTHNSPLRHVRSPTENPKGRQTRNLNIGNSSQHTAEDTESGNDSDNTDDAYDREMEEQQALAAVVDGIARTSIPMKRDDAGRWRILQDKTEDRTR